MTVMHVRVFRFVLNFIGLTALVLAISIAADVFFQVELGNAGTSILPLLLAASLEGSHHIRRYGEAPTKGAIWRAALLMTLLATGLSLIFVAVWLSVDTETLRTLGEAPLVAWPILFVVVIALNLVVSRGGIGVGIRSGRRAMAKAAH
ncbi:ABZJ_00895 family protein [Tropicimonas isoalkanivorans]|uniref:Uncharacterized protein n=1 Tax=Tropicimonas isoalkanivorans TaxID=441112 RepID=A0A1I1MG59_9RHOB|nr:ABZJ_00895 family protein [Tropicimonas isoalkanivorans]SFC84165.1 hypothetical protein SAMN04488094_1105 [Tropicimonas isoalkanivorans]